ncbi:MAG: PH domain-containing protein [archaeon]|nr:PH domain-containing protein [archaeon]MCP8313259.1 PH domain-containing protein [archaeon]MCP8319927.1 PH domain-containing protein [archaeon]
MDKSKKLQLNEDEELVKSLKPHPLAFLDFYTIFSYMMIVSVVFVLYREQILVWLENIYLIGLLKEQLFILLWGICVVLPFLAIAILKITWKWFFLALILVIIGIAIVSIYNLPSYYMQIPSIIASIVGLILTGFYRRGHAFHITNQRIISELRFLSYKRRELTYGKINDLALTKGILGRLFNYGTIFPITASGFGLGEDLAVATAGMGVASKKGVGAGIAVSGGRTVSVPRGRSSYVLFGVRNPDEVYKTISKHIHEYEEAPYLKKILEELKSKKEKS